MALQLQQGLGKCHFVHLSPCPQQHVCECVHVCVLVSCKRTAFLMANCQLICWQQQAANGNALLPFLYIYFFLFFLFSNGSSQSQRKLLLKGSRIRCHYLWKSICTTFSYLYHHQREQLLLQCNNNKSIQNCFSKLSFFHIIINTLLMC